MKPLPANICVGPFCYRVENGPFSRADLGGDAGDCQVDLLRIRVAQDLSPTQGRETLLHETLHAIFALAALDHELGEDLEEKVVRRIAPLLLDALKRNPKLVAYLLEA